MRATTSLVSILLVAAISVGMYYLFLRQASPAGTNAPATQAISTTGVEMDLNSIAQAERMYYTQNGTYAAFDQLVASGDLTLTKPSRDGYAYTVDASGSAFTVTAKWTALPGSPASVHYPTIVVDQTMQVRQEP